MREGRSANYEDMMSGAHRAVGDTNDHVFGRSYGPCSISNLAKMRTRLITLRSCRVHGNLDLSSSVPLCLQLTRILPGSLKNIAAALFNLGTEANMSLKLLGNWERRAGTPVGSKRPKAPCVQ